MYVMYEQGDVNLSPQNIIIYHAQFIQANYQYVPMYQCNVTMLINANNSGWLAKCPHEPDMIQEINKLITRFEKRFISV